MYINTCKPVEAERKSENLVVCCNLHDLNNKTTNAYAWWT
jgi:hypothetical protein